MRCVVADVFRKFLVERPSNLRMTVQPLEKRYAGEQHCNVIEFPAALQHVHDFVVGRIGAMSYIIRTGHGACHGSAMDAPWRIHGTCHELAMNIPWPIGHETCHAYHALTMYVPWIVR